MYLPLEVGVEKVKDILSNKYEDLQKYNDVFQRIYQSSWNGSSNRKLDFSVKCEKCHEKVITRATPGRSLVSNNTAWKIATFNASLMHGTLAYHGIMVVQCAIWYYCSVVKSRSKKPVMRPPTLELKELKNSTRKYFRNTTHHAVCMQMKSLATNYSPLPNS